MKMSTEHYAALAAAIKPLDTEELRERYRQALHTGVLPVDIALDRRYRWDLYWMSGMNATLVESGYYDSHIDTALRAIVPHIRL